MMMTWHIVGNSRKLDCEGEKATLLFVNLFLMFLQPISTLGETSRSTQQCDFVSQDENNFMSSHLAIVRRSFWELLINKSRAW